MFISISQDDKKQTFSRFHLRAMYNVMYRRLLIVCNNTPELLQYNSITQTCTAAVKKSIIINRVSFL